jgi:toxin ParE1/3/4
VTPTRLRPLAEADLVERTRDYRRQAGDGLAARFFDAAVGALDAIGAMPGAGSPRIGELCAIPGLRFRRVVGFPCGWCYFAATDHVDVVRLVADAQDLPAVLAEIDRESRSTPHGARRDLTPAGRRPIRPSAGWHPGRT